MEIEWFSFHDTSKLGASLFDYQKDCLHFSVKAKANFSDLQSVSLQH